VLVLQYLTFSTKISNLTEQEVDNKFEEALEALSKLDFSDVRTQAKMERQAVQQPHEVVMEEEAIARRYVTGEC